MFKFKKLSQILILLIFGFTTLCFRDKKTEEKLTGHYVSVFKDNKFFDGQTTNINGEICLDLSPLSSYDLKLKFYPDKESLKEYIDLNCHISWYSDSETIYIKMEDYLWI